MATYSVDCELASTHIPAHPDRTVIVQTNPYSVYFREFSICQEMQRWVNKQSWQDKQLWSPWMASLANRRLLARARQRSRRASRRAMCEQQQDLLFA